jgi:aryl-alcohol dehydrogenase-like predicted oxidoreductase
MQNHWNLLYREEEREMAALCRDQGVGMIPWSPLARGNLARGPQDPKQDQKTLRAETDRFGQVLYASMAEADRRVITEVDTLAKAKNLPHAQVALAWLLQKGGVTSPIIGATKMKHLEDAVASLAVKLSKVDIEQLEAPYVPHPVAGFS